MAPRKRGRVISQVGTVYHDRDERRLVKLPGQVRDWQVKCVCGGTHLTCNGGWMRQIEEEAKPILVPLIQGKQKDLAASDQIIIATWAVLKAMVSEYHPTSKISTHWMQRRLIRNRGVPPTSGWSVWIASYERKNWRPEWLSFPFFVPSNKVLKRRGKREPTYYNATSTTQIIGKLFIQVVHLPVPFITGDVVRRRIFPSTAGTIFRIWPDQLTTLHWPDRALSDRDADKLAGAMQNFLRSISKT